MHILAFASWMMILVYLPRLFAYHIENTQNQGVVEAIKLQESKLYYLIGCPAMIITILSGIGLIIVLGGGDILKHHRGFILSLL